MLAGATYQIIAVAAQPGYSSPFTLDAQTGELTITGQLPEVSTTFTLSVHATDGIAATQAELVVTVSRVDPVAGGLVFGDGFE